MLWVRHLMKCIGSCETASGSGKLIWQVTKVTCRRTVVPQLKVHLAVTTRSLCLSLLHLPPSFPHISFCLCLFKPLLSFSTFEPVSSALSHYPSLLPLYPSSLPLFLFPPSLSPSPSLGICLLPCLAICARPLSRSPLHSPILLRLPLCVRVRVSLCVHVCVCVSANLVAFVDATSIVVIVLQLLQLQLQLELHCISSISGRAQKYNSTLKMLASLHHVVVVAAATHATHAAQRDVIVLALKLHCDQLNPS